jgi:hypothetical protein
MDTSKNSRLRRAAHSGLGRAFSFRYPAHRVVSAFALGLGLLAGLLSLTDGSGLASALGGGLNAGAAAFVAWALARELDPPRQWSGWLAALLAGLAAIIWGPLALAGPALMLLLLRLVNRAAGVRILRADRAALLLATILALLVSANGWLGIAAALAFLLDAAFSDRTENLTFAGLAGLAGLITWWRAGWPLFTLPEPPVLLLAGVALVLALLWLWRLPRRDVGSDDRGGEFNRRRLRAALLLALAVTLLAAFSRPGGWLDFAALWAALLAALIPG